MRSVNTWPEFTFRARPWTIPGHSNIHRPVRDRVDPIRLSVVITIREWPRAQR